MQTILQNRIAQEKDILHQVLILNVDSVFRGKATLNVNKQNNNNNKKYII